MIKLAYTDLLTGNPVEVEAEFIDEPISSRFNEPVLTLSSGKEVSVADWLLLGYRVVSVGSPEEVTRLQEWINAAMTATGQTDTMREHLRKAGAVKSELKATSSRANGKKGGRPRKAPKL